MICSRTWLGVLPLLALVAGCSGTVPEGGLAPSGSTAPPQTSSTARVPGWGLEVAPSPREVIYIEITPAAVREVKRHVHELNLERWWLRFTLVPGGCTGFQSKLDLDPVPPRDEDFEYVANGIPCLLLKNQHQLVQGTRIDFGEKDGKKGFIVTAPHATVRTRGAVAKWIMDEFYERNPDLVRPAESKTTDE